MSHPGAVEWLTRWERRGLWLLVPVIVLFGVFVEVRSAYLKRRMGDLGVFLRAAWAAREGEEQLYAVTCDNGWHYHYPPLLAILMAPLADAPRGAARPGAVPYEASVAIWYAFSLLCLCLALHVLASALEETSPDPLVRRQPIGARRWWALRTLPLLACLAPVGGSLVRGQVTLLLLALLCAFIAATVRGRRGTAGLFLAGAICLKIIPAFLLILPLWRRDGRCLGGCAVGLVLGLVVVPAAAFGPADAVACYRELVRVLIAPALGLGADGSRVRELIDVPATDSQSFQAVLHNAAHPERRTRPRTASPLVRRAHWLLGGAMTALTLWAFRRRDPDGRTTTLLAGALVLNMILLSPVCHLHYFALAVPLVMGLIAPAVHRSVFPGRALTLLLAVNLAATAVPSLPGAAVLRDGGLAAAAALLLWAAACVTARRSRPPGAEDLLARRRAA